MGVLYSAWDDVSELLIPFARQRGSDMSDAQIANLYRRASLGEMTSEGLWESLGVAGEFRELDCEYLAGHQLIPGISALLDELQARGFRLGCISNDLATWSRDLRAIHGLDRRIADWTISAEVGARKPDSRIFHAFLTNTGLSPGEVVFVDDRAANVDAAAALGFEALLVDFAGVQSDVRRLRTVNDLRSALIAVGIS
jgi:HAD superfamily hydrolase (TIGR01509 family)